MRNPEPDPRFRPFQFWSSAALAALLVGFLALLQVQPRQLAAEEPNQYKSAASGADGSARVDLYGDPLPKGAALRLGTIRLRQRSDIECAAFSADGRRVASAGTNSEPGVYLWDVATGKLVHHLADPAKNHGWESLAFSPDHKTLLAGRYDGCIALWNTDSGNLRWRSSGHTADVTALTFSPDGKQFASGGADGQVLLWSSTGGNPLLSFRIAEEQPTGVGVGESWGVASLAFSPQGNLLAAGDWRNAVIHVWNLATHGEEAKIQTDHGTLQFVAFTQDGTHIISSGYKMKSQEEFGKPFPAKNVQVSQIRTWDLVTGKLAREFKSAEPEAGQSEASLSADRKVLATGGFEAIHIWDTSSGTLTRTIPDPFYSFQCLALSPDGRTLVAPRKNSLEFWDVATGKRLPNRFQSHRCEVAYVACTPDGTRILSGGADGVVKCWNAATGKQIYDLQSLGDDPVVAAMALSRDGALLAVGGSTERMHGTDSAVRLWKTDSGTYLRDLMIGSRQVRNLALSTDDRLLALASEPGGNSADIGIWDVGTGKLLVELHKKHFRLSAMAFSPDAKVFYTLCYDSPYVQVWDVATGEECKGVFIDAAVDAAEGTAAVAGDSDSLASARLGDADAVFSRDATRLIACRENVLKTWDLARGKCLSRLSLPGEPASRRRKLTISPDGRLLAAAAAESIEFGRKGKALVSLCAIDPKTGKLSLVNPGVELADRLHDSEDGPETVLAFSPDNKRLITGTDRGTVLVWNLVPR